MRFRRAAAVLVCSVLVAGGAALAGPASAVEVPRLLSATTVVDTSLDPDSVTTTFHFAGDVRTVDPEWVHTFADSTQQTIRVGSYGVNPGLSSYDLSFNVTSFMAQGTWVLRSVRIESGDGTAVAYGAGAALPIPAGAPSFELLSGPASLAAVGEVGGTVDSAVLASPSAPPMTIDGVTGSMRTDITFSGNQHNATQFSPVYRLVGTEILRGGSGWQQGAASGAVQMSQPASGLTYTGDWRLDRILVRSGPAVRVYYGDGTVDTWVQTTISTLGNAPDCAGYLGDMSYQPIATGCVKITPSGTHSLTGLGAVASTFTVTGLAPVPSGPPVLSNASVSTHTVAAGSQLTYSATYTDPVSLPGTNNELGVDGRVNGVAGISQVSSAQTCNGGAPYVCTVSVTYKVPTGTAAGSLVAKGLYTRNRLGYTAYYSATNLISKTWGPDVTGPLLPTSPHMADLGFTVTNGAVPDSTPPVLTGLTRTTAASFDGTDSGATPVAGIWHWTGTDTGGSGIASVAIVLRAPALQNEVTAYWPDAAGPAATSGDATLTSWYPGEWVVRQVTVTDNAGNKRRYDADGAIVPGTTRHALDFASAGLTVENGPALTGIPSAPRGLTASGRDHTLVASWVAPVSAGSSPIESYDVTLQPGGSTQTVTGTTATFLGLTNEWGYTVTVRANNHTVPGPIAWIPGTWVHPVVPLTGPTIGTITSVLRTTSVSFTGVKAVAQVGAPVTGYRTQVRRAVAGLRLPSTWTNYGLVRTTTPAGSVTAIKPGERVCIRVVAINAVGAGAGSSTRCTVVLADDRSLAAATKGWSRLTLTSAYLKTVSTSRTLGARLLSGPAYGTSVTVVARAIPGGGTVGIYVGTKLVSTWSLAASKAAFVARTVASPLAGQRVTVKVLKVGTAGVVIDGWAVRA